MIISIWNHYWTPLSSQYFLHSGLPMQPLTRKQKFTNIKCATLSNIQKNIQIPKFCENYCSNHHTFMIDLTLGVIISNAVVLCPWVWNYYQLKLNFHIPLRIKPIGCTKKVWMKEYHLISPLTSTELDLICCTHWSLYLYDRFV